MSSAAHRPLARPDTIVSELDDEALIYDFTTQGAHCVTKVAFRVFQLCDGRRTLEGLVTELSRRGEAVPEALVARAVDELTAAGLLAPAPKGRSVDLSRRHAMKKLALTAGLTVAAPMVWSIVAPSVAEAASRCVLANACMGTSSDGTCCGSPGALAGTCSGNMCVATGLGCLGQRCP